MARAADRHQSERRRRELAAARGVLAKRRLGDGEMTDAVLDVVCDRLLEVLRAMPMVPAEAAAWVARGAESPTIEVCEGGPILARVGSQ